MEHADASEADTPAGFLHGLTRAWPRPDAPLHLAVSSPGTERVSSYDNALIAIYYLHHADRAAAASILAAIARLQAADGSIPFSFPWPRPEPGNDYTRSGASAWVGYAATEYLDADAGGPARAEITRMAHGIANYLLAHQITSAQDGRDGLVTAGFGSYRQTLEAGEPREVYVPGALDWVATEHNIDAYFFLRDFARLTEQPRFARAAQRIVDALSRRGWLLAAGQLARGFQATQRDTGLALDCASWGALLLLAAGERDRAETAAAVADFRYASVDADSGALGHRPYAHQPLAPNAAVRDYYQTRRLGDDWDDVAAVWPEGSAGVALIALRLGHPARARAILDQLERLRGRSGGLPNFTRTIPFEFDGRPSLAGTVWVELVRDELRDGARETLWRRR